MDEIMDILSPFHLIVLLVVALLVFGPKRLPEIGSGLGKTIKNFKAAMNDVGTTDGSSSAPPVGAIGHDVIDGDVRPGENTNPKPQG